MQTDRHTHTHTHTHIHTHTHTHTYTHTHMYTHTQTDTQTRVNEASTSKVCIKYTVLYALLSSANHTELLAVLHSTPSTSNVTAGGNRQ